MNVRERDCASRRTLVSLGLVVAAVTMFAMLAWAAPPASAAGCVFDDGTHREQTGATPEADCEADGGHFLNNKQYNRYLDIEADLAAEGVPPDGTFPPGWYGSIGPCTSLASTNGGDNKIRTVYVARTFELTAQIAYDIGSNELTGVTGAVLGVILGVAKVPAFVLEWKYDVQDECQEIVERNTIQEIKTDTQSLVSLVDVAVSTRASQTSVDALQGSVNAFRNESVRLYIEDHLATCRPTASLLISRDHGGLRETTFRVVVSLADRAEASGLKVRSARKLIAIAKKFIARGKYSTGHKMLCQAYRALAR